MKRRTLLKLFSAIPVVGFLNCSILESNDSINWIESNLKIYDPSKSDRYLIKLSDLQKKYITTIENRDKVVVDKDRQIGITTVSLCWNIYNCIHNKNVKAFVYSPNYVCSYCQYNRFIQILKELNITFDTSNNISGFGVKFKNGNSIKFAGLIFDGVEDATVMTLDEAAYFKQEKDYYYLVNNLPNTKVIVQSTSTDNYDKANYFFHRICNKNEFGQRDFTLLDFRKRKIV